LPDNIWRPLYVGNVSNPAGVAIDAAHARLFLADTDHKKIYVYNLIIESDGLLMTDGEQHVAVSDVTAHWLTVNGLGDLYFSGEMVVKPPASSTRSVFRMDNSKITVGDALNPFDVYDRSNSGFPNAAAWMPSGVGVDSFNVYWGNQEQEVDKKDPNPNGSLCRGTRQNIGVTTSLEIKKYTKAHKEVRGMALTGETIFYLTPEGVYGVKKADPSDSEDPKLGLIQGAPNSEGWDPHSIASDGEGTMYYTEAKAGIIYQFPSGDINHQPHKKYVDAPEVFGVAIFHQTGMTKHAVKTVSNYGLPQSSSRAVAAENGARAFGSLRLWLMALVAVATLSAC
jgi:sugar lactone lactonase YvrE